MLETPNVVAKYLGNEEKRNFSLQFSFPTPNALPLLSVFIVASPIAVFGFKFHSTEAKLNFFFPTEANLKFFLPRLPISRIIFIDLKVTTATRGNTKKAKPALDGDISTSGLGASSTPTTPSSTPSTPSTDVHCKERVIRRKVEIERKTDECGHYMTQVDEANILLKNFLSAFDACLQKSEEIALRQLHLKEQKMLERKIEKEQKIMDMGLSGMLPMQRDYYLARQKEILARWTASGQFGGIIQSVYRSGNRKYATSLVPFLKLNQYRIHHIHHSIN
ncbi:hypothetical protein AQUCO_00600120v1 [Aquilegia coerulea]|uniref:No apical meristem-associated C-terminal domain-containing protein n=1 Tax=Aquilegia coerulea TaxID=218851 RepID=A0A2G5ENM6_AQUCA|nr:hypothetical protein AQUCO_00600120v1 [Aquilegia coerulea]